MSLQGSLRSLSIPDLFSLLSQLKKTGLLSLVSRQEERGILFYKGNLVYATSSASTNRLGDFLLRLGLVPEKDLDRSSGGREAEFLGQELLIRGAIREQDLHAAVREQILYILDEALLWEEGAFHFDEWLDAPEEYRLLGPVIPTQRILLDVIRRFDESQAIRESFPNLSVVLTTRDPSPPGLALLDPPTREVLALINAQRSIGQVLRESPRPHAETSRILNSLFQEGWMEVVPTPPLMEGLPAGGGEPCLPVAPDLPGRLYWILRQSGKHLDALAEAVSEEPTLAAKALRDYHNRRDPTAKDLTVSRVLNGLGEMRARRFVLPDLIRGVFFADKDFFWKECREHSLFCARLARALADLVRYPRPGEAYLAGLLHNLGVFVLVGADPVRYRTLLLKVAMSGGDLRRLEKEAFGTTHVKVGTVVAQRWQFPEAISLAIRHHHQNEDGSAGPVVDLVCIAAWAAEQAGYGFEGTVGLEAQAMAALPRFRLKKRQVLALLENPQSPQRVGVH